MELGISIHLGFYRSRQQTIKLKVGELYSRCIIVSSNTLLKVLFEIQIINKSKTKSFRILNQFDISIIIIYSQIQLYLKRDYIADKMRKN